MILSKAFMAVMLVLLLPAAGQDATGQVPKAPGVEATFEYHQLIARDGKRALPLADATVAIHDDRHIAYVRAGAAPHEFEVVRMGFDGSNPAVAIAWKDDDKQPPCYLAMHEDVLFAASGTVVREVRFDKDGRPGSPAVLARFEGRLGGLKQVRGTPIVLIPPATKRIDVANNDPPLGGIHALSQGKLQILVSGSELAKMLDLQDAFAPFHLGWISFDIAPTSDNGWALAVALQQGTVANHLVVKRSTDAGPRVLDKTPAYLMSCVALSADGSKVLYDDNAKNELRIATLDGATAPAVVYGADSGFNTFSRSRRLFLNDDGSWALAGWAGILMRTDGTAREAAGRLQTAAAWSALEGALLQPNLYRPTMHRNPARLVYSLQEWDGEVNWLSTVEINKPKQVLADKRPTPRLSEIRIDSSTLSCNPQRPTRITVRVDTKLPIKRVEGVLIEKNITPQNGAYMFMLYDSGKPEHGDEKADDGVCSALAVVPAVHANGSRSLRLSAEVEDETKLRHAVAVQIGPLPVSAEPPAGAPLVLTPSLDAPPIPEKRASTAPPDPASNPDDAARALEMSVGLIPVDLRLDIDKDGVVTAGDASVLLRRAMEGNKR